MTQDEARHDNFLKGRWLGMHGTVLPQCVLEKWGKKSIKTLRLLIDEVHTIIENESMRNAFDRVKKTKSLTKRARKDMTSLFGYTLIMQWYRDTNYNDEKMEEKIKQEYNNIKKGVYDEAIGN